MSKFLTTEQVETNSRLANPPKPLQPALDSLNVNQLNVVMAKDQYIRTIAGPGTGKTFTLMIRISRIIADGVPPESILALSFTNESANELKDRIEVQCGYDGGKVQVSTFHSKCNDLLKQNRGHPFLAKLGYPDTFFIIETSDAKKLMTEALGSLPSDLKIILESIGFDQKKIFKEMTKHRANCKNAKMLAKETLYEDREHKLASWSRLMKLAVGASSPEEIASAVGAKVSEQPFLKNMLVSKAWKEYTQLCKQSHAIDFDDLILYAYFLLKHAPDVGSQFANQFTNVLGDEYQDANTIQAQFLYELIKYNPSLDMLIVGDPRQSIYMFRNAKVENITHISEILNVEFSTYELTHNYRSSPKLIDADNAFAIEMDEQTTTGQLIAGNKSLTNVNSEAVINYFSTDYEEADFVLQQIQDKLNAGVPPADIYVMYRARAAVKVLEKLLTKNNIPFSMVGETNLFEREEVRDTMAFLRSICRHKDTLAWARTIDTAKIGVSGTLLRAKSKEIEGLKPRDFIMSRKNNRNKVAITNFIELHDACSEFLLKPACIDVFAEENYPKNTLKEVKIAIELQPKITEAFNEWVKNDIIAMVDVIRDKWLSASLPSYLKKDTKKAEKSEEHTLEGLTENRIANISSIFAELSKRLVAGSELSEVVEDLMLRDTPTRADQVGTIKLMTVHASKGLQAPNTFLIGLDTAIWDPMGNEDQNLKSAAENQRLYYVMTTRAELNMYLSTVAYRVINGQGTKSKPCAQLLEHLQYLKRANLLDSMSISEQLLQVA